MTILLTGGTGNTSTSLARQLKRADIPFITSCRKGKLSETDLQDVSVAELDYTNEETYDKPFQHPTAVSSPIHIIYIVVPPGHSDPVVVNAFIDYAVKKRNVSKFVLLGGQGAEMAAEFPPSKVWRHLDQLGTDYAILQPSWFSENLLKEYYLSTIKSEGKLYSATADGRMGFIAVEDIAGVAFALLTSDQPLNKQEVLIIGPEVLDHDEIAGIFSKSLGRHVEHVKLSQQERKEHLLTVGMDEARANFVSYLEVLLAKGMSTIGFPSDNVKRLTGREPQSAAEWIEQNKHHFM